MSLKDTRFLITGGSAGIGRALAALARDRGARVVINGRDEGRLAQTASELKLPAVAGDVSQDAASIVAGAVEQLGGLDVLVNNAGWGQSMTLDALDARVMEDIWRTNVLGAALMAQAALPHLEAADAGAIVNMASTAAGKGYAGGSAYSSSKFALASLTQCWQAELRPRGIRVLQINPSEVQTGFGGRDPDRDLNPRKLFSEDIAVATLAALELDPRGFIPELTVFATNPWEQKG
ncbi:MAG: 3-oxoacyl-[acyl-carrier protein] reductase [Pseudohongiellaceae bacterium]|jgi:3-oxoacyl-[acyl-carrier protein] reductase